jgi:uridine kinase
MQSAGRAASEQVILHRIDECRRALNRSVIVGISGVECAGKSTMAAALRDALNRRGCAAMVASIDDFLNPKSIRHDGTDLAACYYEKTFRTADLRDQLITPVRETGRLANFVDLHDYDSDEILRTRFDRTVDVLIIDGVFLFRHDLREVFDLKIWLEISFEHAIERAQKRQIDLARYGPGRIVERYVDRYFPAQRRHLECDRPRDVADLLIDVIPSPPRSAPA